jgi:hypothetical protein
MAEKCIFLGEKWGLKKDLTKMLFVNVSVLIVFPLYESRPGSPTGID